MPKPMLTHTAWDDLAIHDALVDVFGQPFVDAVLAQNTTKTACGRRVSMSRIVRQNPTCPQCGETSFQEGNH
jgi:hypothetical protein